GDRRPRCTWRESSPWAASSRGRHRNKSFANAPRALVPPGTTVEDVLVDVLLVVRGGDLAFDLAVGADVPLLIPLAVAVEVDLHAADARLASVLVEVHLVRSALERVGGLVAFQPGEDLPIHVAQAVRRRRFGDRRRPGDLRRRRWILDRRGRHG